MSHGEEVGEVAGARERVRIAAVGVDDREKAGDQAEESDQGQQRGPCARAEDRLEAVEQGSGRFAKVLRPAPDGGVQEKDQPSSYDEGGQAPDRGSRDVALWIMRLLGGKWQLFDCEVEPDRERDGGEDARQAKWQEPRLTALRRDVRQQAEVELSGEDDLEEKERGGAQGKGVDRNPEPNGGQHAPEVGAHRDEVRGDEPDRW